MHYYTFSALIFQDGQIRDAVNLLHESDNPSTIVDFRKKVEMYHAGPPNTYSAIIIACWQEIDKATYDVIAADFEKLNEVKERAFDVGFNEEFK